MRFDRRHEIVLDDASIAVLGALVDWPDLSGTRYRILERIGGGGMGSVYSAVDTTLGRHVAIKVATTGVRSSIGGPRLAHEARVLAALEHPGLVPVHDAGVLPDGRPYYVMRLVRGERLDAFLEHAPVASERLRIFTRLCEAIAFAHAHGVVHRDLKPQNVMIGPFGEVLALDWGLARSSPSLGSDVDGELRSEPGTALGTRGYMAPEQAGDSTHGRSASIDQRADVYALGAILAAMCIPTRSRRRGRILTAIIGKARASDPRDRYQTVPELADDVMRFESGDRIAAYQESLAERGRRVVARHSTAIAIISAYLVLRFVLAFARW